MTSIAGNSVKIQTTSEPNPSPPSWFGEVVLISSYLRKHDVLSKISEQVCTRTTISQAHTFQWLGSFGNRGNGRYREELRQGLAAIGRYLAA